MTEIIINVKFFLAIYFLPIFFQHYYVIISVITSIFHVLIFLWKNVFSVKFHHIQPQKLQISIHVNNHGNRPPHHESSTQHLKVTVCPMFVCVWLFLSVVTTHNDNKRIINNVDSRYLAGPYKANRKMCGGIRGGRGGTHRYLHLILTA